MQLEVNSLTKFFGGLAAIYDMDIHVDHGEIVGLIGPNGAGKTTLFNLITGFLRPTEGTVLFEGKDITGQKPHLIAKLGIGRTFQLVPLFGDFSVFQNVVASFHLRPRSSAWEAFFNTRTYRRKEEYILKKSEEILVRLGLHEMRNVLAKHLPHGYQKMLGLARALAVEPTLLLMDEPIGGMTADEIALTRAAIGKLRDQGVSILVVEHNMQIMDICDRVVVMNFGQKIAEGTLGEVRENERVNQAYFGGDRCSLA
jgi:branched-chain amino acid transport system ATP-binding protein